MVNSYSACACWPSSDKACLADQKPQEAPQCSGAFSANALSDAADLTWGRSFWLNQQLLYQLPIRSSCFSLLIGLAILNRLHRLLLLLLLLLRYLACVLSRSLAHAGCMLRPMTHRLTELPWCV